MSILVYHGAADTVRKPLASYGRPDLDFGQGFDVRPNVGHKLSTYVCYEVLPVSTSMR